MVTGSLTTRMIAGQTRRPFRCQLHVGGARYSLPANNKKVITRSNFGNTETNPFPTSLIPARSMRPIRKAVFPVAGLGTRFLPATKAMPKEMLPVVDRPLIQHVVDEARAAGIEHFIFVTGRNKGVIEDHFDRQFELEHTLTERQKHTDLAVLARDLPGPGSASFTRQQLPLGLGHAVWCARELVGHEPFALLLPDVLVQHNRGCLGQMIDAAKDLGSNANIIAVEAMAPERIHMYGVVGVGAHVNGGKLFTLTQMVEKPRREQAPSHLIITGRYILQPEIFDILAAEKRGAGGEIQLTDAMIELAKRQPFYGLEFEGRSFDCGSKVGFLAANVAYALAREDLAPAIRAELKQLLG
jgi:UTP--glucose-1-phosphate uridylyltransferase